MPPLIIALLLGAGTYAGYRAARRLWTSRVADDGRSSSAQPPPAEPEAAIGEKDLGTLEYDPATGVYRPSPRT